MIILPANTLSSGGYEIANSCRFNSGDSPSLKDGDGSAPAGNRQKFTFSCWFKRAKLGVTQMFAASAYSSSDEGYLYINGSDHLVWHHSSTGMGLLVTTQKFRDVGAWYHLVWSVDTTQGTAANRMKFYINGSQVTSFSTETYPDVDKQLYWNVGGTYYPWIGRRHGGDYMDGYLAEIVHIDNAQLAATSFGEFDSDSPTIWKPIDVSGLTFGTAGYHLDFEDSSELGKDVSGQGNHFGTVANLAATDQATDTPTNNFATLNPLEYSGGGKTFSQGNCKLAMSSVANFTRSTIGASSGKWYCEVKLIAGTRAMYGISSYESNATSNYLGEIGNTTTGYSYGIKGNDGRLYHAGSSTATWVGAVSADDIVMIAMDLDNYKLYFGNNGTWERSGDPTSGATGTGAYTIVAPSLNGTGFYHFAFGGNDTSYAYNSETNFGGCSSFTVSSGNADDNGYGNFEYDVPSGYYALCTKNLAEFG